MTNGIVIGWPAAWVSASSRCARTAIAAIRSSQMPVETFATAAPPSARAWLAQSGLTYPRAPTNGLSTCVPPPPPLPATVIGTAVLVVARPALLVARAVSEYEPAATFDQVNAYGLEVSVPSSVEPLKKSTLVIVPLAVLAVAARLIVAGAVNEEPADGLVNATVGAFGLVDADGEVEADGEPPPPVLPVQAVLLKVKLVPGGFEPLQLPRKPND